MHHGKPTIWRSRRPPQGRTEGEEEVRAARPHQDRKEEEGAYRRQQATWGHSQHQVQAQAPEDGKDQGSPPHGGGIYQVKNI